MHVALNWQNFASADEGRVHACVALIKKKSSLNHRCKQGTVVGMALYLGKGSISEQSISYPTALVFVLLLHLLTFFHLLSRSLERRLHAQDAEHSESVPL